MPVITIFGALALAFQLLGIIPVPWPIIVALLGPGCVVFLLYLAVRVGDAFGRNAT